MIMFKVTYKTFIVTHFYNKTKFSELELILHYVISMVFVENSVIMNSQILYNCR